MAMSVSLWLCNKVLQQPNQMKRAYGVTAASFFEEDSSVGSCFGRIPSRIRLRPFVWARWMPSQFGCAHSILHIRLNIASGWLFIWCLIRMARMTNEDVDEELLYADIDGFYNNLSISNDSTLTEQTTLVNTTDAHSSSVSHNSSSSHNLSVSHNSSIFQNS